MIGGHKLTKSNKKQQNNEKSQLTARQLKIIPIIVTSSTYSDGCKKARLNRTTFYQWLKQQEFKAELDRQREEIASEAFGVLAQTLTKAVETLVGLLDTGDDRVKRLTANDIISHYLKHKEIKELDERIQRIEERLDSK
jgi:hypothetical protein